MKKKISYPKPFQPTQKELTEAAQTVAKQLSTKFVLKDPESGQVLARGQRAEHTIQNKSCPSCSTPMSMGASHSGSGIQWECFSCGRVELA